MVSSFQLVPRGWFSEEETDDIRSRWSWLQIVWVPGLWYLPRGPGSGHSHRIIYCDGNTKYSRDRPKSSPPWSRTGPTNVLVLFMPEMRDEHLVTFMMTFPDSVCSCRDYSLAEVIILLYCTRTEVQVQPQPQQPNPGPFYVESQPAVPLDSWHDLVSQRW